MCLDKVRQHSERIICMNLTLENMNYFSIDVLQILHEECNVTFMINDGYITGIGYMFG